MKNESDKLLIERLAKPALPVQMPVPMDVRVLRRQKTMLQKKCNSFATQLAEVRSAQRVIRWAKRFVNHESDWNKHQLKCAVKAMMKPSVKRETGNVNGANGTGGTNSR